MKGVTHRDVLVRLARQHGWTSGVELGVKRGQLFLRLLTDCPALHLTGVDHFIYQDHEDSARAVAALYPDRARLIKARTEDAAALIPDGSVDFVFIDADHGYESCARDIRLWRDKVKPGGWFGGHDYADRFPGVVQAVREAYGDQVRFYENRVWQAVTP